MWNIFNKRNKELRFKILEIRVRKNIELNLKFNIKFKEYSNTIKVKCLNDGLIFMVHDFYDENLSKIENKSLLKSILIKEYNKSLKEEELYKNSKKKKMPPKFLCAGDVI